MPEKSGNSPPTQALIFRLNSMTRLSFRVLTLSVFLGILIVWGIDGWSVSNVQQSFVIFMLNNQTGTQEILDPSSSFRGKLHRNLNHTPQNLTQPIKKISVPSNLTRTKFNFTNFSPRDSVNLTSPPPSPASLDWIFAELEPNFTSNLLARWLAPGDEPCKESRTVEISIPSLDIHPQIELSTGDIHEFVFQSLDDSGKPHCLGGDYFETDLSGDRWKSRPPINDFGNGTYSFSLQVHPDFAGDYNLTIILLFRHFEGLKFSPQRFAFDKQLRRIPIKFNRSSAQLPEITTCNKSDFARDVWSGRWTRHGNNESCSIDDEGRFRCLNPDFPCQKPWCDGSLGLLESNGWIYSSHCSFRLFSAETAWDCLKNRWIFFWGDSNHCDTIRNVLHFILDVQDIASVPRRFDMNVTNPKNPSQVVRITSIFNGHENENGNYQGLNSLRDDGYRDLLRRFFSDETVPDTVIVNSGLHDGVFWPNIRRFVDGAERAAAFWADVVGSVRRRGVTAPEVIYRSTVATGGYARMLAFNPNKMEAFNGVFLEKLRRRGLAERVVDHFDMTFPWHFDNRCNDGVHYGRAPANARWRDGQIGHQYFVDLMLGHVLLNAICAR
ncbi:hypothetical protein U1Q18_031120 [Sarracenia purpurea var. burkii]